MRRLDWLLLIFVAMLAIGGRVFFYGDRLPEGESGRRPEPRAYADQSWSEQTRAWLDQAPAKARNSLSDLAPVQPQGVVEVPERQSSSSGSAFSVSDGTAGVWLTARHVVDGCKAVGLQTGPRKMQRVERRSVHPGADVAVLVTRSAPEPVPLAARAQGVRDGYAVGFPRGEPGTLHGRLIGEQRMSSVGRYRTSETVQVWSERSRLPGDFGSLGGLSGGPVFDRDGRVIGIAVAESRRRGRFYTARPETFRDSLVRAEVEADADAKAPEGFSPDGYGAPARELILSRRVSRVLCLAG
jgi:serine protease Do